MGGVDGLLKVPPHRATPDDLIEEWSPDIEYEGLHQTDIDVTGGIGLKIRRGHLRVGTRGRLLDLLQVRSGDEEVQTRPADQIHRN